MTKSVQKPANRVCKAQIRRFVSTNAIIFARVSSTNQADGHSLIAQVCRMQEHCKRNGLEIIYEFRLIETSTSADRAFVFNMLECIKNQEEPIALVVDGVDKLQRSFKEIPILEELRIASKVSIHFLRENQVLDKKSHSAQLMAYQMFVLMATAYANSISDNVKRGFDAKRRNGESLGHVPIGYLTKDGEVTLDPFKSVLVRQLFDDYSTGLYSIPALAIKYGKKGLTTNRGSNPISKSQVDRMIYHPFYYGFIDDIDEDDNPILRPHKYEKIITRELFEKCQAVKAGKGYNKHKTTRDDFIFTTLVKCKHCNCSYSPYTKKSKYIYLRPNNSRTKCERCMNINENILLREVKKVIESIVIPENVLEQIKEALVAGINVKYKEHEIAITEINMQLPKIREAISNWNLRCAQDMSITPEERHETLAPLREKQAKLEYQLSLLNNADQRFEITVSTLLDLASKSYKLFMSSRNAQKQQILKILFSNLFLDGQNPCVTLCYPFSEFVKLNHFRTWSG